LNFLQKNTKRKKIQQKIRRDTFLYKPKNTEIFPQEDNLEGFAVHVRETMDKKDQIPGLNAETRTRGMLKGFDEMHQELILRCCSNN
jgi:hypothetical protein